MDTGVLTNTNVTFGAATTDTDAANIAENARIGFDFNNLIDAARIVSNQDDNLALALLTETGGNTGLYEIDLMTGAASLFADLGTRDFASFVAQTNNGPAPVPLPASALMLLAGLGGLQLMRRRKTKA